MMEKLEKLISALRHELQHYGEMLARLDDQQEFVMRRAPEGVLQTVPLIQDQSAALTRAREGRISTMKELCIHLLLPEQTGFNELIPKVPPDYRPLLQALVQENNELLVRVQQRARQNHILLTRTVESMQRVINSLTAQRQGPLYGESGNVTPATASGPALYEAVC